MGIKNLTKVGLAVCLALPLTVMSYSSPSQAATTSSITNSNGIVISAAQHDRLVNLGFEEEEIMDMDQEEFDANKDLEGEVVDSTTQYLKIVENPVDDPYEDSIMEGEPNPDADDPDASVSVESDVIELDEASFNKEVQEEATEGLMGIASSDSSTTKYKIMKTDLVSITSHKKYRVKNSVTWKKMPATRTTDVNGVGISTAWDPIPNTQYGKQNWTKDSTCYKAHKDSAKYTTKSTKWKKGSGGYSLKMNLPNDDFGGGCGAESVIKLSSYMYYSIERNLSTYSVNAYGQYAHQESSWDYTPSISLTGIDFSISPRTKFSKHPNTHVRKSW